MNKSLSWKIGDVEVIQVVEIEAGSIIQEIIPEATPDRLKQMDWLMTHFINENGEMLAQVQAFLIKSNGKNILIDTCNGNDKYRTDLPLWGNLQTKFLENLRATGVSEDEIDIVACTHLHFDHVGWNTILIDDEWVPTFPNAEYLFAKEEYDYWKSKPQKEVHDDKQGFDDSVKPVVDAGLHRIVESDERLDENVRLIPTPGHTPGHVSIMIESEGKKALITGDLVHHPAQVTEQEWTTDSDTYPEQGVESRKKTLAEIVDTDVLLIGSHFADPVVGKVVSTDEGEFRFVIE